MRVLYSVVLVILLPLALLRLTWLGFKNPDYWRRWSERFGLSKHVSASNEIICLHAVSVGEVQAARPLVSELRKQYPQYEILLTTTTPTGADTVRRYFPFGVKHGYMPYDLPCFIKAFLSRVKPTALIVIETELWPNLFHFCHLRNIPVAMVNVRMSEKSARGYQRLFPLTKQTLRNASVIMVQSEAERNRLIALGAEAEKLAVTGNLKFDIKLPQNLVEKGKSLRRYFSIDRPVWIAASTHEGEEQQVLTAFSDVLGKHKNCLLIIAPRHPERSGYVVDICNQAGLKTIRKSQNLVTCEPQTQVFILDELGELISYYAAADVAFIGGSLTNTGGHNMLEAASLGIPMVIGYSVFNFIEISKLLLNNNAAWKAINATELASLTSRLLSDADLRHHAGEQGRRVVMENQGCVKQVIDLLEAKVLSPKNLTVC